MLSKEQTINYVYTDTEVDADEICTKDYAVNSRSTVNVLLHHFDKVRAVTWGISPVGFLSTSTV